MRSMTGGKNRPSTGLRLWPVTKPATHRVEKPGARDDGPGGNNPGSVLQDVPLDWFWENSWNTTGLGSGFEKGREEGKGREEKTREETRRRRRRRQSRRRSSLQKANGRAPNPPPILLSLLLCIPCSASPWSCKGALEDLTDWQTDSFNALLIHGTRFESL